MEPLRRAVRDRTDFVGATGPVLVPVRLDGDERGTRANARLPTAEWALAGGRRWGGGREFLGDRVGGQHAHDSGGHSGDIQCFARRSGSLPAIGGFVACPFEIPALRPTSSIRPEKVWLAVGPRHGELGGADIDGAHRSRTRKETGTDPRQGIRATAA